MWNDKHTVTRVCSYVFSRYLVTTCFRASSEECLNKSEVLHHGDDWKEYEILRWHPFGFFHLTALKRWKESVHVRKTTCTQRNGDFLGCLASITSRIYPRLSTYIVQYIESVMRKFPLARLYMRLYMYFHTERFRNDSASISLFPVILKQPSKLHVQDLTGTSEIDVKAKSARFENVQRERIRLDFAGSGHFAAPL